jgi:hypothetical protein
LLNLDKPVLSNKIPKRKAIRKPKIIIRRNIIKLFNPNDIITSRAQNKDCLKAGFPFHAPWYVNNDCHVQSGNAKGTRRGILTLRCRLFRSYHSLTGHPNGLSGVFGQSHRDWPENAQGIGVVSFFAAGKKDTSG